MFHEVEQIIDFEGRNGEDPAIIHFSEMWILVWKQLKRATNGKYRNRQTTIYILWVNIIYFPQFTWHGS